MTDEEDRLPPALGRCQLWHDLLVIAGFTAAPGRVGMVVFYANVAAFGDYLSTGRSIVPVMASPSRQARGPACQANP
jgi:hypothetical protein